MRTWRILVAVLRYRLWDLGTGLLLLPYLLIVLAAGRLTAGSSNLAPRPRASRCAAGSRTRSTGASTGARTVEAFATGLREQVDLGDRIRRSDPIWPRT